MLKLVIDTFQFGWLLCHITLWWYFKASPWPSSSEVWPEELPSPTSSCPSLSSPWAASLGQGGQFHIPLGLLTIVPVTLCGNGRLSENRPWGREGKWKAVSNSTYSCVMSLPPTGSSLTQRGQHWSLAATRPCCQGNLLHYACPESERSRAEGAAWPFWCIINPVAAFQSCIFIAN